MPKLLVTATEIRSELQPQITETIDLIDQGWVAPMPMSADKRLHVANWKLPEMLDIPDNCVVAFRALALAVMREYEMKDLAHGEPTV